MKVGIVLNFPPSDHRAVFYDGIARELLKQGYDIELIMQKGELQFEDIPYGLTLLPGGTYSITGQVKFMYHALKKIKREKYDIIHARNPFSSLIPSLIAKSKSKIVYDIRGLWVEFGVNAGYYSKNLGRFFDFVDVRMAKMSDAIIVISPLMKSIIMDKGIHKKIIEVVPVGVDVEKFARAKPANLKKKFGIEGKIVGYVGSISLSRGSDRIIEAFRFVRDEIDSVYLIMVGPVPVLEKGYFEKLIRKLKLENFVIFTNTIPHYKIPNIMKCFDITVSYFPFNNNIFNVAIPIKILEYIAAGVPIVATKNLCHKKLIKNGVNGFLVDQNLESMSAKIVELLNDEKLRRKMSRDCKNAVIKYSFKELAKKIKSVYDCLLLT